jgi:ABC-2 type transport system permease protein
MLLKIASNEFKVLVRDRTLIFALPLYILILLYGVFSGTGWKDSLRQRADAAVSSANENTERRTRILDEMLSGAREYRFADDPRVAGVFARIMGFEMASKSPSPTAAFAVGQSDVEPSYLRVQWKPMFKQTNVDEVASPRVLEVGPMDLGFVIVYLYPLLIIALSYNILSSERENGTQSLLLSQPVSVSQFVVAKLVLRGAVVIGIGTLVTTTGLLAWNADILASGYAWRIGMFVLAMALYGTFWFGVSVVVNAFMVKSATNALVMIVAWIALVVVVPAAVNLIGKSMYPLPSRIEMVNALREGEEAARLEVKNERIFSADLLARGEEAALETGTLTLMKRLLPLEQRAEELAAPVFDEFNHQKSLQRKFASNMRFLSPATVVQAALNGLADNGESSFSAYSTQVIEYQRQWRSYFLPFAMEGRLMTLAELKGFPRFNYRPDDNATVLGEVANSLWVLLVYVFLVFLTGFLLLKRYSADRR